MTPLPPPLGSGELVFWRLDQAKFRHAWDRGEGSYLVGGRWSSRGVRAVYAALDPATQVRGKIRVRKSDFDRWLERHRIKPAGALDLDGIVREVVEGVNGGR